MMQDTAIGAEMPVAGTKRLICRGIVAMLLLTLLGCATTPPPKPAAITQMDNPSQGSAAAPGGESGKEGAAGGSIAALAELLKRKNVINADEAALFIEQYGGRAAGGKGAVAPADGVAALVELLKKKNVVSADEADDFVRQYAAPATGEKIAVATSETLDKEQIERITASVTQELKKSVQEQVNIQVKEELPKEIKKVELSAAVPEWTKRIRFGGDVRLRYESDRYNKNNADFVKPDAPTQLMNTKIDQDRFRYRIRVGVEAKVNDQVDAVARLSTGNDTNPVSTNSLLGDYWNRDRVYFDLAYLKWQPWKFLNIYGGRMPNIWFSSDLVWSQSLNFEGLALSASKTDKESWSPFLTLGAFPLQQNDFSQQGKWMTAGQLGVEMKRPKGVSAKIAATYYDFRNITGVANDPYNPGMTDWTAPLFQQKGNTLFDIGTGGVIKTALASEFKELNITGSLDIGLWDPVHVVLLGDYVKNLGFNKADVAQRTGNPDPEEWTTGYQFGMAVGYPIIQDFGQWKVSLYYKYLGADAVVDAFTDSDFHLGGTNAKGWIIGAEFGLLKNFWLTGRWLTADQISGPPLAIDVLQVDLNARF